MMIKNKNKIKMAITLFLTFGICFILIMLLTEKFDFIEILLLVFSVICAFLIPFFLLFTSLINEIQISNAGIAHYKFHKLKTSFKWEDIIDIMIDKSRIGLTMCITYCTEKHNENVYISKSIYIDISIEIKEALKRCLPKEIILKFEDLDRWIFE